MPRVRQFPRHSSTPLGLGLTYLIVTFVLFYIGPMTWQLRTWLKISIYVPVIFLTLYVSFSSALNHKAKRGKIKYMSAYFLFGSISAVLLLYPTAVLYTGRTPWQVFDALADQRSAYSMLREQLEQTQGARAPVALIRSIFSPFIFCVLPLAVIYWKSLSNIKRLLLLCTVLSTAVLSILRGTTRELADVIIVGGSAYLIHIYRQNYAGLKLATILRSGMTMAALSVAVLAALSARASARMAGTAADMCIGGGSVCPSFNSPFYRNMPDYLVSALATITGYFAQGYYGLALALDKGFVPTWGLGHSPALGSLYQNLSGDSSFFRATYIERLNDDAWFSDSQWSTALTWFASDLSFWGVPLLIFGVGVLWARSWVDAVYGENDKAAIFFCIMMMFIFYLPANNQIMNTFENYSLTVFWGVYWVFSDRNLSGSVE